MTSYTLERAGAWDSNEAVDSGEDSRNAPLKIRYAMVSYAGGTRRMATPRALCSWRTELLNANSESGERLQHFDEHTHANSTRTVIPRSDRCPLSQLRQLLLFSDGFLLCSVHFQQRSLRNTLGAARTAPPASSRTPIPMRAKQAMRLNCGLERLVTLEASEAMRSLSAVSACGRPGRRNICQVQET